MRTEFGKTLGGFSHYSWNEVKKGYVKDPERKSFIVSLDLKVKLVPSGDELLIRCDKNMGPCFGWADLWIDNRCNSSNKSQAVIASHYNEEGKNQYYRGQSTNTLFSGVPSGDNFNVVEY